MLQFQIVVNTLKVTDGNNTIFSISKKDVYYVQTSLNEDSSKISLYNLNVGVFAVVFKALLSECSDPNGNPFTVNSFTDFAEVNLGFNTGGASSTITVTDSYATLPNPTTVSGQFFWCENADSTFPVGLYYSDGTTWQFQVADDITVVANYSALPNPTTVSGQFFWAEASQGTSWLPNNVGGTYYSAGMYYSNGVSYSFIDVPYQATQNEVNTGTNTNKFVTPNTLKNQDYLATVTEVNLRIREILQDFTDYTSIGVLTEQIISNQAITANNMKSNSWLNLISTYTRTGTTNATVSHYLNTTSNSLIGAVKIATASITSSQSLPCFKRDYSINASSVLRGLLFTANFPTDEISTSTQSTTTLTLSSPYYLITTATLNSIADTVTQRAINLKSTK